MKSNFSRTTDAELAERASDLATVMREATPAPRRGWSEVRAALEAEPAIARHWLDRRAVAAVGALGLIAVVLLAVRERQPAHYSSPGSPTRVVLGNTRAVGSGVAVRSFPAVNVSLPEVYSTRPRHDSRLSSVAPIQHGLMRGRPIERRRGSVESAVVIARWDESPVLSDEFSRVLVCGAAPDDAGSDSAVLVTGSAPSSPSALDPAVSQEEIGAQETAP